MRRILPIPAVLLALLAPAAPSEETVTLKNAKYPDLVRTVRDLQGKVVVVDFWADFCIPCKKEFPHLVEMQHKYAAEEFAAVSVSLDDPADADARERALKFLRAQKAEFTNLLLDEPAEVRVDKLKTDSPPFIFVFGRDGRLVKSFVGDEANYAQQIEPLVADLLKK